jgi:LasA protease
MPRLVFAALAALIISGMACARSDVPVTAGIGGGGLEPLASATQVPPEPSTLPPTDPPTSMPATPTPLAPPASPTVPPTPTLGFSGTAEPIVYEAQGGDTLPALAARFGVVPEDITSSGLLPQDGTMIDPGQLLFIPRRLAATGPGDRLVPDSEVVFSPHAVDFDATAFVAQRGGYLADYRETVGGRLRTGPEVLAQVARDNSVNPRLLLALLEYQAGWVTDPVRPTGNALRYPMGNVDPEFPGLFRQLTWVADELGNGYYGWRAGSLVEIHFDDDTRTRLAPDLNAGTVALQYYFAVKNGPLGWAQALAPDGFIATYQDFFGDPWEYFHPLFEPGVVQPPLDLPFLPGHTWSFTGGPHGAWEFESAWAALDFAPATAQVGCDPSEDWAVASAPGLVLRSGGGVVVLDLDGDGREQTGWVLVYLHVANLGRVGAGEFIEAGDLLGHPSCEGGLATGTHLHIARKYNGEWILADGPLPFELSGWVAHGGTRAYEGYLTRGDAVVIASPFGTLQTQITR